MCTGCFDGIARSFLYLTNLLVFLLACVILGLSIWIVIDSPSFVSVADSVGVDIIIYDTAGYIIITISSLVIIITFLGCCGAAKHSRCLLATYFVFVLLLLIGISVGAYYVLSGNIDTLKEPFFDSLKKYDPNDKTSSGRALVDMWDDWQQQMKCCGVDRWQDWAENENFDPYYKNSGSDSINRPDYPKPPVPDSCCDPNKREGQCEPLSSKGIYLTGCFQTMLDEIEANSEIIGGVAIGIIVVMLPPTATGTVFILIINAIIALFMATCGYHSSRPKHHYSRTATSDQL